MALTVVSKPSGFQPVGAGSLLYKFTEASISGKPNYKVQIQLDGYTSTLPIMEYTPKPNLEVECDIAPLLRAILVYSDVTTDRLKSTYVKYQAVWDGGSDAQVNLSADVIYAYAGYNTPLFPRTQFQINANGGKFLTFASALRVWAGRTAYLDWLSDTDLGTNTILSFLPKSGADAIAIHSYNGTTAKVLKSIGYQYPSDGYAILHCDRSFVSRTSAADISWASVVQGGPGGTWVAVANAGAGNRVMSAPAAGTPWTLRASADDTKPWVSVAWGNGKFVACNTSATGTPIMYSTDGITWSAAGVAGISTNVQWHRIVFANGVFVSCGVDRIAWSLDGVTWSEIDAATVPGNTTWTEIAFGNGRWVILSTSTPYIITSTDLSTWTTGTIPSVGNTWTGLTFGNGRFVAVSQDGTNRVMYSFDGLTWVAASAAVATTWNEVTFGNGRFLAVSSGVGQAMYSVDGKNWTSLATANANSWTGVNSGTDANGKQLFVIVGVSGTGTRVETLEGTFLASIPVVVQPECQNPIYLKWLNDAGGLQTWLFDWSQRRQLQYNDLERLDVRQLTSRADLTANEWLMLAELTKDGLLYGDNSKVGQWLYDFTVEASPIKVVSLPRTPQRDTKTVLDSIDVVIRYPKIENLFL